MASSDTMGASEIDVDSSQRRSRGPGIRPTPVSPMIASAKYADAYVSSGAREAPPGATARIWISSNANEVGLRRTRMPFESVHS
jgi:hypothetical protein